MFALASAGPVGWQPSRFLTDRSEAERAFQLAERLGSINATAAGLGTTWPSLRKAFTHHGIGMPGPGGRPGMAQRVESGCCQPTTARRCIAATATHHGGRR